MRLSSISKLKKTNQVKTLQQNSIASYKMCHATEWPDHYYCWSCKSSSLSTFAIRIMFSKDFSPNRSFQFRWIRTDSSCVNSLCEDHINNIWKWNNRFLIINIQMMSYFWCCVYMFTPLIINTLKVYNIISHAIYIKSADLTLNIAINHIHLFAR